MNMQLKIRGFLTSCALVSLLTFALQACGDSGDNAGGGGAGGAAGHNAGAAGRSAGGGADLAGSANGDSGAAGSADAGAPSSPGEGGNGADAGASGSGGSSGVSASSGSSGSSGSGASGGGAGGAAAVPCHISWTGAATGEADCTHRDICHKNFLSLGVHDQAPPPSPLTAIQLVYSPDTDLTLGPFTAVGVDMANCHVNTIESDVGYSPQFDKNNALTGGTSMSGTLTALQFSTDPNDPCLGVPHGSFDVVLRQRTNSGVYGDKLLSLHADF